MKLPPSLRTLLASVLAVLGAGVFVYLLRTPEADAQTTNCPSFTHQPGDTDPEVILGTTPTRLPALCARRGMAIQNLGTSTVWCTATGVASHARAGRSWKIAAGDAWSLDAKDTLPIYCLSESAQSQGAATIVMEMR